MSSSFSSDYNYFPYEQSYEEDQDYDDEMYEGDDLVGRVFDGKTIRCDRNGSFVMVKGYKHYITNKEARKIKSYETSDDEDFIC